MGAGHKEGRRGWRGYREQDACVWGMRTVWNREQCRQGEGRLGHVIHITGPVEATGTQSSSAPTPGWGSVLLEHP